MPLTDAKYMLLTTYRRNATPVSSPVWVVALDDKNFGFWTSSASGKAKRLAHTERVIVQPCNARGKVTPGSTPIEAKARLASGSEFAAISQKIKSKYGFMTTLTRVFAIIGGLLKRKRMAYGDVGVVVTPAH